MKEAGRIINLRFLLFLCILLFINTLLITNSSTQDGDLSQAYDEMMQIAIEKKQGTDTNREAGTLSWEQYFSQYDITDGGSIMDDTDEERTARAAREMLMTSADYVDGFQISVQEKREKATQLVKSGIYGTDSFEYSNLLKTRYDLGKIEELEVSLGNGIWLEKLFGHSYIMIFSLLLLWVTVYGFFAERKTGLYYIVHAAKSGRANLFLKRCLILFVEAFVIQTIFYVESALLFLHIHGGIEGIGQPATGSEVFFLTAGSLTRIEFVGMLILMSTVSAVVLSLLLWFVLSFFSNVNIGITVYLLGCAADMLLYLFISSKSVLRALHFVNVNYLLFPNQAMNYYNWGYSFGITSIKETTLILVILIGIGTLLLNLHIAVNKYYTGNENRLEAALRRMMEVFMHLLGKAPTTFMEIYKLLVSQKVGPILIVLFYVVAQIKAGPMVLYDAGKSYLSGYYESANGFNYSPELEAVFQEYQGEYNEFVETIDYSIETAGTVLQNRTDLLAVIRGNVEYVRQMNEKGVDAVVLKPYEYEAAFGTAQGSNQRLLALLNVLAVIVVSCGFISYEKKNDIHRLALSYCNRRRWLIRKCLMNLLLITVFALVSYGIYYWKLFTVYQMDDMWAPLKSLPMFQNYAVNPSIGGFLILDFVVRLLLLSALSAIISYLSIYVPYLYCLLTGLLVVVPQFLYMIGFHALDRISIGRYVSFLPCFHEGILQTNIYYVIAISIIIAGSILYIQMFRNETVSR